MALEPEYVFKVVIAGPTMVGKTSLVFRYTDQAFLVETKKTIGVDFALKKVDVDLKDLDIPVRRICLQLWDFAGESRFDLILPYYLTGTHIVILAFDSTRPETLNALPAWLTSIRNNVYNVPIILISTKNDLGHVIPDESINKFIEKSKIEDIFHTSSKTGENVDKVFQKCVDYAVEFLRQQAQQQGFS
ncbi:MAG: Rab family GTPase, partial [Candidatus Hodarchaeota archaeon]